MRSSLLPPVSTRQSTPGSSASALAIRSVRIRCPRPSTRWQYNRIFLRGSMFSSARRSAVQFAVVHGVEVACNELRDLSDRKIVDIDPVHDDQQPPSKLTTVVTVDRRQKVEHVDR